MKGDIAVAGLMITAEEWKALDAASRAELVDVITRREEPAGAVVTPAILAEGTNPSIEVRAVSEAPEVPEVPEVIEELPSSAVSLIADPV
ncbi:MAG: hypothetical protein AB7T06_28430 [Kofleriaceae bacterium]